MTSDIEGDFQIQMQISLYNLLDVNYYTPYRTIYKNSVQVKSINKL